MIGEPVWELSHPLGKYRLVSDRGNLSLESELRDDEGITTAGVEVPDLSALALLMVLRQHLTPAGEPPDFATMADHVNLWSAPTLRGRFRVTFIGRYVRLAHDHVEGRDDTVSVQLTDGLARELWTALGHWLEYRASQAEETP